MWKIVFFKTRITREVVYQRGDLKKSITDFYGSPLSVIHSLIMLNVTPASKHIELKLKNVDQPYKEQLLYLYFSYFQEGAEGVKHIHCY